MKILQFVYCSIVFTIALSIAAFLKFYVHESPDWNVILFGLIIYAFFSAIYSAAFSTVLLLFNYAVSSSRLKSLIFLLPNLILILQLIVRDKFEVYNWSFTYSDFVILNVVVLLVSFCCQKLFFKNIHSR